MFSKFYYYIKENDLISPNERILIAVSGGMDSMCLLHLLNQLREELGVEIAIAHINHNLRMAAAVDEQFVKKQADILGIPHFVNHLDSTTRKSGESVEAWARSNRYAVLEEICQSNQYDKVATGHHGNDQIETILHRIGEKSGVYGLQGIYQKRGRIIRPLLSFSKNEIVQYVKSNKILFIEDETNQDTSIPRNYLRHKIIAQWEDRNPNIVDAFQSVSNSVNNIKEVVSYFLDDLASNIVNNSLGPMDNLVEKRISLQDFDRLPETVKVLLFKYLIDTSPWRQHQWSDLKLILNSAKVGNIYRINNWQILKDRKEWIIRPKFQVSFEPKELAFGKLTQYDNYIFKIRKVTRYEKSNDPQIEIVDGSKLNLNNLVLRLWNDGDSFQPLGMSGRKKVSDFLTDIKMNKFIKNQQIVLTSDNQIIWVCGQRIDERIKTTPATDNFVELSVKMESN